jgi:tetratricopeptide (TPR) repeat protein
MSRSALVAVSSVLVVLCFAPLCLAQDIQAKPPENAAARTDTPAKARGEYEFALASEKQGALEKALEGYSRAIALDPGYAPPFRERAGIYFRKGDFAKAAEDYTRYLGLEPKDTQARYFRGLAYSSLGEHVKVIEDTSAILALNPRHFPALMSRGAAYLHLYEYALALLDFDKALKAEPSQGAAHASRGLVFERTGLADKALEEYGRALSLARKVPQIHYRRGALLARQGDLEAAAHDLSVARGLSPGNAGTLLLLGAVERWRGRSDEAAIHLARILETDPENQEALRLSALAHKTLGEGAKEKEDVRRLLPLATEPPMLPWAAARAEALKLTPGDKGLPEPALSLQFTKDGKKVVAAFFSRDIRVVPTGEHTKPALFAAVPSGETGPFARVTAAALSPDGKTLAAAGLFSGNAVLLYDTQGRVSGEIPSAAPVLCLRYQANGQALVFGDMDGKTRVYNPVTRKITAELAGHRDAVAAAALSPDGRRAATSGLDGTVRLWDTATGKPVAVLTGHEALVTDLDFTPDGNVLVTAGQGECVRAWDAKTGAFEGVLLPDAPRSVAFALSASGIQGLASDGRVFPVPAGEPFQVFTPKEPALAVALAPDGGAAAFAGYGADPVVVARAGGAGQGGPGTEAPWVK